jgi:prefoldin subunit 5
MDIWVKTQVTGNINIVVPFASAALALETGSTLTVKIINPAGADITASVTAPTITEVVAGQGIYLIQFPSNAATPTFTLTNELNPYHLVIKTSVLTGYRTVIRVYCVDRLPGEIAKSTEVAALDTVVDTMATAANLTTVDTVVDSILSGMATATNLAAAKTVVDTISSTMATSAALTTVDTVVDTLTTNLAIVDTVVDALAVTLAGVPTLAQIEASTVIAKAAATTFLTKCIKNKKKVKVISGVLYLIIYDDDNVTEILRKAIKDVDGTDVSDPAAGVIALETKSTV